MNIYRPHRGTIALRPGVAAGIAALLLAACLAPTGDSPDLPGEPSAGNGAAGEQDRPGEPGVSSPGGGDNGQPAGPPKPGLLSSSTRYGEPDLTGAVVFTFNMEVTALDPAPDSGLIRGDGGTVLTVTPVNPVPGIPVEIRLTVADKGDPGNTLEVSRTLLPVGGPFTRPGPGSGGAAYHIVYYDENGVAALKSLEPPDPDQEDVIWYYVSDPSLQGLFNALYTPNAPGTIDRVIDAGKQAAPYTPEISALVLNLFTVTVGEAAAGDSIELSGTELPAPVNPAMARYYPVVIDLGLPDTANTGLPVFRVPHRGLGGSGEYPHIRVRVNRGVHLVILADNSDYLADGPGHPSPYGNLTGATVEVMGGAYLRNGAYEGCPLGEDTALIIRLGACFALGPEDTFNSTNPRDADYTGWFIGSAGPDSRISWEGGDQNGSYLEWREDRLAFDVNLRVRKPLILARHVWFVNGPALTIDTAAQGAGLFAGTPDHRFYGTFSQSGGQNPARPAARIIIAKGNALSRSFLTGEAGVIGPADSTVTIPNRGRKNPSDQPVKYIIDSSISGYSNWGIPGE
jgi:hypothetical protein